MDNEEFEYYLSHEKCLVGRVRVNITSLTFSHGSRGVIPRKTARFRGALRAGYDVSRHNPLNRLEAHISSTELDNVLLASQLTRGALQASLLPGAFHPKLNASGTEIKCFEGQNRFKAAESVFDANDYWWTIDLYAIHPDGKYEFMALSQASVNSKRPSKTEI
jgi:hypothetical protein